MNGFSQGGGICFSDSSQPWLTDTGKVTLKKKRIAAWSDERARGGNARRGCLRVEF